MKNLVYLALAILVSSCGETSSRSKIVGGKPAEAAAYSGAALFRPDSSGISYVFCSGTLIAPRFVLTAAHCSIGKKDKLYNVEDLFVVIGNSNPEGDKADKIPVVKLHLHPAYDLTKMSRDADGATRLKDANDIAIWELAREVTHTKPVTFLGAEETVTTFSKDGRVVIAGFGQESGWGSPWIKHVFNVAETVFTTEYEQTTTELVEVQGIPRKKVSRVKLPARTNFEIYAGAFGHPDTCKGDSGGPLFVKAADGALKMAALTSRGSSVCETGGAYTLTAPYLNWIEGVVKG